MVDASHRVDAAPPSRPLKRFVNTRVVPIAIDAAGSVEVCLERCLSSTRQNPALAVASAVAVGFLLTVALRRR